MLRRGEDVDRDKQYEQTDSGNQSDHGRPF